MDRRLYFVVPVVLPVALLWGAQATRELHRRRMRRELEPRLRELKSMESMPLAAD